MKDLNIDVAREYIVRHNHELRSILTSVGRLIPEKGERLSFSHLGDDVCAALKAFCGTLEFRVVEVATMPGQLVKMGETLNFAFGDHGLPSYTTPHYEHRPDAARILVAAVNGSNFPASNSKCQPILQTEPQTARSGEETGPLTWSYGDAFPGFVGGIDPIEPGQQRVWCWPIIKSTRAITGDRVEAWQAKDRAA